MTENNELYLQLNDNEWPDEGTDHDRQIVRAIVTDGAGGFVFVRLTRQPTIRRPLQRRRRK